MNTMQRAELLSVLYKHANHVSKLDMDVIFQLCKSAKANVDEGSPILKGTAAGAVAGGLGGAGLGLMDLSRQPIQSNVAAKTPEDAIRTLIDAAKKAKTHTLPTQQTAATSVGSVARLKAVLKNNPMRSALRTAVYTAGLGGVGAGVGALGGMAVKKYKESKKK